MSKKDGKAVDPKVSAAKSAAAKKRWAKVRAAASGGQAPQAAKRKGGMKKLSGKALEEHRAKIRAGIARRKAELAEVDASKALRSLVDGPPSPMFPSAMQAGIGRAQLLQGVPGAGLAGEYPLVNGSITIPISNLTNTQRRQVLALLATF